MKKTKLIAIIAVAFFIATLSSCSSKEMLDMVPADVDYVATVDLDRLIEKAGFEITAEGIKGPEEMSGELKEIPAEIRNTIVSVHDAIDCRRIILMGYLSASQSTFAGLAEISDNDRLKESLANSDYEREKADGFTVYRNYGSCLVIDDDYIWLVEARKADDATALVKKIKVAASQSNLTSLEGVVKLLAEEKAVNMAMKMSSYIEWSMNNTMGISPMAGLSFASMSSVVKDKWANITLDLEENQIEAVCKIFHPSTGDVMIMPGTQQIDDELLKYLPANTFFATAVGIDNKMLRETLKMAEGFAGVSPIVMPIIKIAENIDGTVCVGLGADNVAGVLAGTEILDFTVVIHYLHGDAAKAKTMADDLLRQTGLPVAANGGITELAVAADRKWYMFVEGENLIISCRNSAVKSDNIAVKALDGSEGGMEFYIPDISTLTDGQSKMSVDATLICKEGIVTTTFKFGNFKGALVPELMKAFDDLKNMKRKVPARLASDPDRVGSPKMDDVPAGVDFHSY